MIFQVFCYPCSFLVFHKYRQTVNGSESYLKGLEKNFLRFGGILHGRISLNAEVARQEAEANQQIEPAAHIDFETR